MLFLNSSYVGAVYSAKVSLDRINEFLHEVHFHFQINELRQ